MKRKIIGILLTVAMTSCGLIGCGSSEPADSPIIIESEPISASNDAASQESTEETTEMTNSSSEENVVEENHDNMYRSELTNEWIDLSLENQRPVAIIVDNEKTALDHYGLTQADIIYEIVEEIGVLSESAKGWRKELNRISWNG